MFGDILNKLMKENNMSRDALAKRLGVSYWTISKYVTNKRSPDPETINKIADIFNVSVDYLHGRTNDPTPPEQKPSTQNNLPPLTPKDERDIGRDLERILNNLESDEALAFHGEPIDEETKELLRISLENSMRLAKQIAKSKFTPKKYRK